MLSFFGPALFATTVDSSGIYRAKPGQQFTVHVGKNGAQFTAVTSLTGTPLGGVVTAAGDGAISFADPTDTYRVLWLRDGAGNWIPCVAVESAAQVDAAIDQAATALSAAQGAVGTADDAQSTADAALDMAEQAIAASALATVGSDLGVPVTIAHRGGGTVWPEESVEGMDAAAAARFAVECDVQPIADGTLVCCHDNTVERTMSGIAAGNVGTKTLAQWRAATVKPAIRGGKAGTPTTFTDVLDRFGGRVELWAEIKSNNYSATVRDRFIAAVKARNLQKAVVAQTFTWTVAQQLAAAGLRVAYLTGSGAPSQTWAEIKDAGIEWWAPSTGVAQSLVTAAKGAGLKVAVYTVTTAAEHAPQAAKGVDAIFSDDPWGSSGRVPLTQTDPFRQGSYPVGMFRGGNDSLGTVALVDGGIGWPANGTTGPPSNNSARLSFPWAGPINFPTRVSAKVRIGPANVLTGGIAFLLLTNSIESYVDGALAGQNGWLFLLRKNQQFNAWEYVNGAAAAAISGLSCTVPGTAPTVLTEYEEYTLSVTLTATAITVQIVGRGGSISATATHSRAWTNLNLGGRFSTFGSMSDVTVVPL